MLDDRSVANFEDSKLSVLDRLGVFRRIAAVERDKVYDHLLRLDDEDRLLRFGNRRTDQQLRAYCDALDWQHGLVIGYVIGGELRAIGEFKPFGKTWFDDAEIALSVERPWQDRGIGSELLLKLIIIARNRMIRSVYMLCLPKNAKLVRLVRKIDAELIVYTDQIEAQLKLAWPDQRTIISELLDGASALFGTMYDWTRESPGLPTESQG